MNYTAFLTFLNVVVCNWLHDDINPANIELINSVQEVPSWDMIFELLLVMRFILETFSSREILQVTKILLFVFTSASLQFNDINGFMNRKAFYLKKRNRSFLKYVPSTWS
jgi:hypothetical protein